MDQTPKKPILLTGKQMLASGAILYLGFEQITEANVAYWHYYYNGNFREPPNVSSAVFAIVADYMRQNQSKHQAISTSIAAIQQTLSLEKIPCRDNSCDAFIEKIYHFLEDKNNKAILAERYKKIKTILDDVPGGAQSDLVQASAPPDQYYFMVYGATQPIDAHVLEAHCCFNRKDQFLDQYGYYRDIVITMPFSTKKGSPIFTHFGLFKNPWHILDPLQQYRNATMVLMGFSAFCVDQLKYLLGEKLFLSTKPMLSLVKILSNALGDKNIHVQRDKRYKKRVLSGMLSQSMFDQYGEDLTVVSPEGHGYLIQDPDSQLTVLTHQNVLNQAPVASLDFPSIIIKKERLTAFYDNSQQIHNTQTMLRALTYLKKFAVALPHGLSEKIRRAYPLDENSTEILSLDRSLSLYQTLSKKQSDVAQP